MPIASIAAAGLVVALLCGSAAAAVRNGQVAFVSDRGGSLTSYVMRGDGALATPLRGLEAASLAWSPDGRRLAVAGPSGLSYVINANGRGLHSLVPCWRAEDIAWSPDGAGLAFAAQCGAATRTQLYVAQADGTGTHALGTPLRPQGWPAWSPDGARLAYTDGWFPPLEYPGDAMVGIMNSDGSDPHVVASGGQPTWSPDGKWIAFSRPVGHAADLVRTAVFVMHPDGSAVRRLTHSRTSDATPAWSPDGRYLLYVHDFFRHHTEIHRMRADGTGDRVLTPNPSTNSRPAWQPLSGPAPAGPPLARAVVTAPFSAGVVPARGQIRLRVACRGARSCTGRLSLFLAPRHASLAGSGRFAIGAHRTGRVLIRLQPWARGRLGALSRAGHTVARAWARPDAGGARSRQVITLHLVGG